MAPSWHGFSSRSTMARPVRNRKGIACAFTNGGNMRTVVAALMCGLAISLSGCGVMNLLSFQKHELTGKESPDQLSFWLIHENGQVTASSTVTPQSLGEFLKENDSFLAEYPSAKELLKNECAYEPPASAGSRSIASPVPELGAAVVGGAVNLITNELHRRADEIDKGSKPEPYTGREILSSQLALSAKCAVFMRYTPIVAKTSGGKAGIRFMMIATFQKQSDPTGRSAAMQMRPVFTRARDSVAWAAASKSAMVAPRMDVAIGIALKCNGQSASGTPRIDVVGADTMKIRRLCIGPKPAEDNQCVQNGAVIEPSDLIPLPPPDRVCSLTFSIAEIGDVGLFDKEYAQAQLRALHEALGPGIAEVVKIRWTSSTSSD